MKALILFKFMVKSIFFLRKSIRISELFSDFFKSFSIFKI